MINPLFLGLVLMTPITGCAQNMETVSGESLVLAGETPGRLLCDRIDRASVIVRSTYLPSGKTTTYESGRDYVIDANAGTIARTQGTRIPDFSNNVLFGKKDFNHAEFPGYGNGKFFVYVDYKTAKPLKWTEPRDVSAMLAKTAAKLRGGRPLKVIAYGDSITAGGDASTIDLQYPALYAAHLRLRFPSSPITLENGATGGDNTINGLQRLDEKVLTKSPDLVLVAFGMNDHNVGSVPVADFRSNLKQIVARIREKTGAEVILLSTFPPNPDWHFSSHQMHKYARATEEAANELGIPCADVFGVWQKALARKDPPSLLANNINHPNDFGHWLYLQALIALEF